MVTFRNNKKKDWFPHETKLVFVHGQVCKERSRNSATFKMEVLQELVMIGFTIGFTLLRLTRLSLQAKLKSDENGHVLEAVSDKTCF